LVAWVAPCDPPFLNCNPGIRILSKGRNFFRPPSSIQRPSLFFFWPPCATGRILLFFLFLLDKGPEEISLCHPDYCFLYLPGILLFSVEGRHHDSCFTLALAHRPCPLSGPEPKSILLAPLFFPSSTKVMKSRISVIHPSSPNRGRVVNDVIFLFFPFFFFFDGKGALVSPPKPPPLVPLQVFQSFFAALQTPLFLQERLSKPSLRVCLLDR